MKVLKPVLVLAVAIASVSFGAHAQTRAPGLWEHSVTMKSDDGAIENAMAEMQKQNAKKQSLRQHPPGSLRDLPRPRKPSSPDKLSDLSAQQSMRLQMQMDRRSKCIESLSNIMKKTSETQSTIIQNLK